MCLKFFVLKIWSHCIAKLMNREYNITVIYGIHCLLPISLFTNIKIVRRLVKL